MSTTPSTTEEERAAIEWLAGVQDWAWSNPNAQGYVATVLRMLSRPVMPEEPTAEALNAMYRGARGNSDFVPKDHCEGRRAYRALYAHLSKPATKTVEVWRVEYALCTGGGRWTALTHTYETRAQAEAYAIEQQRPDSRHACIKVTGPHQQEIPA